jgi:integration host factor subunit alpha
MSLTKADLVESICKKCGYSRAKSVELVESTLETIKMSLESGEDVLLSGFGKFCVQKKTRRKKTNPQTDLDLMSVEKRFVMFKCSSVLREKLNKG